MWEEFSARYSFFLVVPKRNKLLFFYAILKTVWITLEKVLHSSDLYIPRENLLFTKCGGCHRRIVWRAHSNLASLNASCCHYVFDAVPINDRGDIFKILMSQADMSNVILISALG